MLHILSFVKVSNFIQGSRVFVQRVRKVANTTEHDVNKTFSHSYPSLFRYNGTLLWQTNIQGFSLKGFAGEKKVALKSLWRENLNNYNFNLQAMSHNLDSFPFGVLL